MEEILVQVKTLSGEEIRAKLIELGEKVGPITPATKSLFEKKLARKLFSIQHPDGDADGDAGSHETINSYCPDQTKSVSKDDNTSSSQPVKNQEDETPSIFYGVCLPGDIKKDDVEDLELAFSSKTEALNILKKYPGSRFKVFKSLLDAKKFSLQSADDICPSPRKSSAGSNGSISDGISTSAIGVSVESSPYRGPKVQKLLELMKTIENGDYRAVEETIWENPRYLISSGDTPVILKEGPRYNALHIAAIKNHPSICQLVLDTLEDPDYIDKMYGHTNETETTRSQRIGFLVDLYLNTPDKAALESPLHFACKFGHKEVVAVLSSHPKTDKYIRNKYGETPKQVICSRVSGNCDELKSEIKELLEGQYYVPLVRSEDNTTQPMIGRPWTPDGSKSPLQVPVGAWNPKDPLMAVKACAGPMTPSRAETFHRRWTTPPSGTPKHVKRKFVMTKREDSDKGLERIGRDLAHEMKVPWMEYWDFLQTYVDLTSDDGLELLEEYLQKQSVALCLAEGMEILTNSFHASDQQRRFGDDKNPWKMMESIQEMTESDDIVMSAGCGSNHLDEDSIPPEFRKLDKMLANGSAKRNDIMQSSFDGREFDLTKAYPYCYDQHYYDRSLDSSWTQEDLSSALSPISCLTALFSKLSILDRSQRMRMRPGGCLSCMGGPRGGTKHLKDRDFQDRRTEYVALSSSPVMHNSKSENDAVQSGSQKCFEGKENEMNHSISCPSTVETVTETDENALQSEKKDENVESIDKQFNEKCSLNSSDSFKTCADEPDSDMSSHNFEDANSDTEIIFEMDKSKMSEDELQELFEVLSERKSVEHKIMEKEKPSKVGRDIVLDLINTDSKNNQIVADLAVIPVNSSVAEIKLFPRIPFRILSGNNLTFEELDIPNSPSVIKVKFNVGSENEFSNPIPALAIYNYVKGKSFFVSGYQPTKSDLDVYRATENIDIDDRFTLVKKWRAAVLSYLTDSTFSWKSPAKVKPRARLSASFPQVSTPRHPGESPVIFYHSPVVQSPKPKISETWSMSNIKAQLFA